MKRRLRKTQQSNYDFDYDPKHLDPKYKEKLTGTCSLIIALSSHAIAEHGRYVTAP